MSTAVVSSMEEILAEMREGRMVVLVDDEGRENEGDLIISAERASSDAINFMAKHGRGLICLALTRERVEELQLPLMASRNLSRHQTAFTLSVEARDGVTTGISAADRARTVAVAIDPDKGPQDIQTPGHVFPLVAQQGGVLVRAGHTEAAVDLARLAGFNPSGVICEIMSEDGSMARMPELRKFAQQHSLKVGTIADLIAYRLSNDTVVRRILEKDIESRYGGAFRLVLCENTVAYAEHAALVKGDLSGPEPVLVRVHAVNFLGDLIGDEVEGAARGDDLHAAMRAVAAEGRGVVVLIREPRQTALSDLLRRRDSDMEQPQELREVGVGAQILVDLGVRDMILLSNAPRPVVGLDGYGLTITGQRLISASRD